MPQEIAAAMRRLLPDPSPLLVGVSGGADSIALLHLLVAAGQRPHVAHLNHQWRGADSEADAAFVREQAARLGLPVTIGSAHVAASENAARQARLTFFQRVARETAIGTLALAHTADDQVETLLLRLLRGAGTTGLAAMREESGLDGLRVVRPLLAVTRAELLAYLDTHQLAFREDTSNADRRFLRNRIRHELLPLLERDYNPAVRAVLHRTATILADEDAWLDEAARSQLEASLHVPTLQSLPVALQRRVVRQWLAAELEFDHIESVRACPDEVHLPGGLVIRREYDWLRKASAASVPPPPGGGPWPVMLEGETRIAELGLRLVPVDHGGEVFDAATLGPAPVVRTWREGDRFQPLGMAGEKKLQDFFVDQKIPRHQRGRVPLLCATDGRIAWVIGQRMAEPFKVTAATRRTIRWQAGFAD